MAEGVADYEIRSLSEAHNRLVYDAVNANRERLEEDFPHLVEGHRLRAESFNRTESNVALTWNPDIPYRVLVAVSKDGRRLFGMGTVQNLGRRSFALLGLSFKVGDNFALRQADIIAGWTTEDAPEGLALAGLQTLLHESHGYTRGKYQARVGSYGNCSAAITVVRSQNKAAQRVASEVGMLPVPSLWRPRVPTSYSPRTLRAAGISSGPAARTELWAHTLHD